MAGAVLGYNVIICMPKKMSGEKVNAMKWLGATILRTPTEAAWNDPDSHITLAARLQQTKGDFTHLVMTAGTGGTLTGIARKIKEKAPHVKIVGIDPVGSILAKPDSLNDHKRLEPYHVEGIGYDFIPTVLEQKSADVWLKSNDEDSFKYARALIRHEGLMIGGSCGGAMHGAVDYIRREKLGKESKVVVLFADSTRNYMSKFLADEWMQEVGLGDVKDI